MLPDWAAREARAADALPADVLAYYGAGAADEVSLREATAAWAAHRFRPVPLRPVGEVSLGVDLLGAAFGSPVAVAPTASHGAGHPAGEPATMAATSGSGHLMVVSTRASRPYAEIAAAARGPWWFQVYAMRDRPATLRVAAEAAALGASALVLTGDTPYVGRKPRTVGVRLPTSAAEHALNVGRHLSADAPDDATEQDPDVGLDLVRRLHEETGLPVLVKGVLRGDAAAECVEAGAAGIVVSNHGGRQLDRALPSAFALPEVVAAVGDRVPVLVDGGLRSGHDVLTALALGASAVLVGRPVLWALADGGEQGVRDALAAIDDDLAHVLALAGAPSVADLPSDLVVRSPLSG